MLQVIIIYDFTAKSTWCKENILKMNTFDKLLITYIKNIVQQGCKRSLGMYEGNLACAAL